MVKLSTYSYLQTSIDFDKTDMFCQTLISCNTPRFQIKQHVYLQYCARVVGFRKAIITHREIPYSPSPKNTASFFVKVFLTLLKISEFHQILELWM